MDESDSLMKIYEDAADLAAQAADFFLLLVRWTVETRGHAYVALSGGSTPEAMYKLIADRGIEVDWSKVSLFLGDERFVPYDDPQSNFGMILRTLLEGISIPKANVFPIPTSMETADDAAREYEATLRRELPDGRLDMVFLGLGEDGHTASLFPGFPSLSVTDRWVVASPPGTLPPPFERITMTYPILNAAHNAIFLVSGAKKAGVLQAVRAENADSSRLPAAGIHPLHGKVLWLVDKAAAMV